MPQRVIDRFLQYTEQRQRRGPRKICGHGVRGEIEGDVMLGAAALAECPGGWDETEQVEPGVNGVGQSERLARQLGNALTHIADLRAGLGSRFAQLLEIDR